MSKQDFHSLADLVSRHKARLVELTKAEGIVAPEHRPIVRNVVATVDTVLKCATGAINHRDYQLTMMCIAFARGGFNLITNLITCPNDPLTKLMAADFKDKVNPNV